MDELNPAPSRPQEDRIIRLVDDRQDPAVLVRLPAAALLRMWS